MYNNKSLPGTPHTWYPKPIGILAQAPPQRLSYRSDRLLRIENRGGRGVTAAPRPSQRFLRNRHHLPHDIRFGFRRRATSPLRLGPLDNLRRALERRDGPHEAPWERSSGKCSSCMSSATSSGIFFTFPFDIRHPPTPTPDIHAVASASLLSRLSRLVSFLKPEHRSALANEIPSTPKCCGHSAASY